MVDLLELKKLVGKTVAIYNRYRSPEAVVTVKKVSSENVAIEFSGSFCYGCGVEAYLEDFMFEFQRVTEKVSLESIQVRQTSERSFRVDYKVKSV